MNRRLPALIFLATGLLLFCRMNVARASAISPASDEIYIVQNEQTTGTVAVFGTESTGTTTRITIEIQNPNDAKMLLSGPKTITVPNNAQEYSNYGYTVNAWRIKKGDYDGKILFHYPVQKNPEGAAVSINLSYKLNIHVVEKATDIPVDLNYPDMRSEDYIEFSNFQREPKNVLPGQHVRFSWTIRNTTDRPLMKIPRSVAVMRDAARIGYEPVDFKGILAPYDTTTTYQNVTTTKAGNYTATVGPEYKGLNMAFFVGTSSDKAILLLQKYWIWFALPAIAIALYIFFLTVWHKNKTKTEPQDGNLRGEHV